MIYIKRTLWLLGYPIMWLLSCALFSAALVFMGFEYLYLCIKNCDIIDDCIEWCIKLIYWYEDIEPNEN